MDLQRSNGYVEVTGADSGHLVGSQTSGAVFGCMGHIAIVADGPAVDCLFSGDVPNPDELSDGLSVGQSDFAELVASPKMVSQPLSGYEFSHMSCWFKLFLSFL